MVALIVEVCQGNGGSYCGSLPVMAALILEGSWLPLIWPMGPLRICTAARLMAGDCVCECVSKIG